MSNIKLSSKLKIYWQEMNMEMCDNDDDSNGKVCG